ncbi:MAG: hypothetical protein ACPGTO_02575 [Polaribacter sp.]
MRKIIFILITVGILFSCTNGNDSNKELIGNWKLIEILADPGDGSGTFSSVQSNKIITFESSGIITSNGNLCDMTLNSDNQTSGTYSDSESTFNSSDCNNPSYNFSFEQNENILIVNYPCIEPCQAKYIKQ